MKKMILSLLAIAAMTSCTTTSEDEIDPNAPVEIKLQASVDNTPTIIGRSTGAVDGLTAQITDVALVHVNGETPDWSAIAESDVLDTSIATDGIITLPSKLYFPADGSKENFIGYHPKSAGKLENKIITFTTTGKEGQIDIMYAGPTSGNKATKDGCITPKFSHKLSQLKFKFVKDVSYTAEAKIKELKINGTKLPASMALENGAITYGSETTITVFTDKTYEMAGEISDIIMVEPGATITADITITIGSTDYKITDIAITATTEANKAHLITLTFKQQEVSGKAEVDSWAPGSTGSGDIY